MIQFLNQRVGFKFMGGRMSFSYFFVLSCLLTGIVSAIFGSFWITLIFILAIDYLWIFKYQDEDRNFLEFEDANGRKV